MAIKSQPQMENFLWKIVYHYFRRNPNFAMETVN